jgi:hypothetical protein
LNDELFVSKFAPGEGVVVKDVGDQPPLVAEHPVVPVYQRTLRLVELLVYPLVDLRIIPKIEQMTVQPASRQLLLVLQTIDMPLDLALDFIDLLLETFLVLRLQL